MNPPTLIDLRRLHGPTLDNLQSLQDENILVWSLAPLDVPGLALISGPSSYLTWVINRGSPDFEHPANDPKHHGWCQELHALKPGTPDSKAARWHTFHSLKDEIIEHLNWEDQESHPLIDMTLGTDRVTRELRYEHSGIRKYLENAQDSIFLDKTTWSQFSLDCIHLLEHNIARKYKSVVPVMRLLLTGEKRKRLEDWLRR